MFLARVEQIKLLVSNTSFKRAVYILAEAEGITKDELGFYGFEVLEHQLGLKFGSIKAFLEAN